MSRRWAIWIMMGVLAISLLGGGRAAVSADSPTTPQKEMTYVRHPAEIRAHILDLLKNSGQEIRKIEDQVIATKYKYVPVPEIRELSAMPNKSEASGFQSSWLWARYYEVYQMARTENGGTRLRIDVRPEAYNASAGRWIRFQSNGFRERQILNALKERLGSLGP